MSRRRQIQETTLKLRWVYTIFLGGTPRQHKDRNMYVYNTYIRAYISTYDVHMFLRTCVHMYIRTYVHYVQYTH